MVSPGLWQLQHNETMHNPATCSLRMSMTPQHSTPSSVQSSLTFAGIGGDAFALYYDGKTREVSAFMANGQSPAKLTLKVRLATCLLFLGQTHPSLL